MSSLIFINFEALFVIICRPEWFVRLYQYIKGFMELSIDEDKWINYILNLESKLKDRFKVLKNEGKISEKEFDSTCPVEATPSVLYGNPKVHEIVVNNTPKFRPILSSINTPTYFLAKYQNPLMLSYYLPTSFWKKLSRAVSTIYSQTILTVVN